MMEAKPDQMGVRPGGRMENPELTSAAYWASVLESIANWAFLVVVLALAIEFIAGRAAAPFKEKIDKARETQIASAIGAAGAANERAAGLEREAARLHFQLDQEIQKRAQRILTDEQKAMMTAELRGKIPEINVVVQRDIEARAFALQLEIVFQAAGMTIHPYELPAGDVPPATTGVLMYKPGIIPDTAANQDDPLYATLKKVGLAGGIVSRPFASLELTPHTPLLPVDTYTVYVCQKSPF
jgi:hypothetical protein